jgi:hypothetical protein
MASLAPETLNRSPRPREVAFELPPLTSTADGRVRKVGVEVEFAGLSVQEATDLVRSLYGGVPEEKTRFTTELAGSSLGDFRIEIDSMPLKRQGYKAFLDKIHAGETVTEVVEDVMESVIRTWVPTEIVSAPIEMRRLSELEPLRWALLREDAEGTKKSILYGFGFQLNPELPSLEAEPIGRYLRSFIALYDWLLAVIDVDVTRAYSPFVDAFPVEYRQKILAPDYAPDLDALIGDYLEHNPTRNRPLDMLPAFASLQKERVLAAAKEPDQVKARPTFHYRLPNCLVDDPSWSFALEWNRWVEVERLAEDRGRLEAVARELVANPEKPSADVALERAQRWGVRAP